MKLLLSIVFTAIYGLMLRLFFGFLSNIVGIMSFTFLVLIPVLFGYVTILLMPKDKVKTRTVAFFLPTLPITLVMVITILFKVEGLICWIMLFPLCVVLGGIGGLWAFRKYNKMVVEETDAPLDANIDKWGDPNKLQVSLLFLIPIVLGAFEGEKMLKRQDFFIEKSHVIRASPTAVWQAVLYKSKKQIETKSTPFYSLMGFPTHTNTYMDSAKLGGLRYVEYNKGLKFEEKISEIQEEKLLRLEIKVDPHKIPPTVLDEHILIGGKHLDILEDVYTLEAQMDGSTKLSFSCQFYINTPFNWYAGLWARFLMAEILESELEGISNQVILRRTLTKYKHIEANLANAFLLHFTLLSIAPIVS